MFRHNCAILRLNYLIQIYNRNIQKKHLTFVHTENMCLSFTETYENKITVMDPPQYCLQIGLNSISPKYSRQWHAHYPKPDEYSLQFSIMFEN